MSRGWYNRIPKLARLIYDKLERYSRSKMFQWSLEHSRVFNLGNTLDWVMQYALRFQIIRDINFAS